MAAFSQWYVEVTEYSHDTPPDPRPQVMKFISWNNRLPTFHSEVRTQKKQCLTMKREDFIALFKEQDDPVRWEYPQSMDYTKQVARFRRFVAELERRLGEEFDAETESQIQDASFHSQITVGKVLLRFSNFGDMVATTDDDSIAPSTLNIIKELIEAHGYRFIPHDLLEERYSGRNHGVTGIRNWWIRYFDWV